MKKLFYFAAAAVALAACAKNEVIPVNSGESQEITFNVAPKTKAGTQTFNTKWNFKAYAYYYAGGNASATPQLYINNAVVSYQTITTETGDKSVWKSNTPYYWPKNGSLTFFAWTSLKETVGNPNSYTVSYVDKDKDKDNVKVTCSNTTGIKVENYEVDSENNKNVDLLVADIKADQEANTTTEKDGKYYNDGVPTLFRHKLSYVIFNVVTDQNYSATKRFELKSITFKDIEYKGNYQQIQAAPAKEGWIVSKVKKNQTYYTAPAAPTGTGTTGVEITSTAKTLTSDATQNYFLPQEFSNADKLVITYEVTTTEGTSISVDHVEKEIVINPAEGSKMFESWLMGKKYTVTLTFKLDEILWDPAVEDWTTADGTVSSDVK